MYLAHYTVIAVHADGHVTKLGGQAKCWETANGIATLWRATYRCPVHVVPLAVSGSAPPLRYDLGHQVFQLTSLETGSMLQVSRADVPQNENRRRIGPWQSGSTRTSSR